MKRTVLIVLVLAVVVGAAGWLWHTRAKSEPNGPLRLYGNVDIREVSLGFRVPGLLSEVLREEGDPVKAGDILAKLDDTPFQREVQEAKARVEAAAARVQLVQAGSRQQEVDQARAVMQEREVSLANAERIFKRQEELFQTKAVSQQERDDAEARFREAQARLNSAREQLSLLIAGFRIEEKAQAQAELERAKAGLASAELRVSDTELKAPSEGVVLTRAQEPGAVLQMGAPVLTVSLIRPVWVRAYVNEPDLGRIKPGTKVRVYTDSRPERAYTGQVGFVSPRAEFTPKNVETPELRTTLVFRLRITISDADDGLRQGMPVTVIVDAT